MNIRTGSRERGAGPAAPPQVGWGWARSPLPAPGSLLPDNQAVSRLTRLVSTRPNGRTSPLVRDRWRVATETPFSGEMALDVGGAHNLTSPIDD